jgi:hypothetical protein
MAVAIKHQGAATTASGLDVLAGLWLLISPFVLGFGALTSAMTNNVILGIVIGVLALVRFFGPGKAVGISWLNLILGIWVLISPWVVGFTSNGAAVTNNVIVGIIVIILAAWSALATDANAEDMTTTPRGL